MKKNYIAKLKVNQYSIGSFDAYIEEISDLISKKENMNNEEVALYLSKLPATSRAAIFDEEKDKLLGYIGLSNVDNMASTAKLESLIETNESDINKIKEVFCEYVDQTLNIKNISNYKNESEIKPKDNIPNIILPGRNIIEGITENDLLEVNSWFNANIKLNYPCTVVDGKNNLLGVIGLSNLLWPNRRADLSLYLNPKLSDDIKITLGSIIIDQYLDYAHNLTVNNISAVASFDNEVDRARLEETSMSLYAEIPFSLLKNDLLGSKFMYQSLRDKNIIGDMDIKDEKIKKSVLTDNKEQLDSVIKVDDNYSLVKPTSLSEDELNVAISGHIMAMQNREKFSIPIGEDKYILQLGNERYGIHKAFLAYTYVLLDQDKKYAGYASQLRKTDDKSNVEIEFGIKPELQNKGIGRKMIDAFYNELFLAGYSSITSVVFSFNDASLALHEKIAQFNGVRLESYYINGNLHDMNYYTQVHSEITKNKTM